MSKFHVGDKVRLVDRDDLFEQFILVEDNGFDADEVYTVDATDTGVGGSYGYDGPTYRVSGGGDDWDVPEEIMRPAEIVALVVGKPSGENGEYRVGDPVTTYAVTEAVDVVNHPVHYNRFPVEVINITEQLDFNRGNAVKYLARAGFKEGVDELEDLSKAAWYVNRAIEKLQKERDSRDD